MRETKDEPPSHHRIKRTYAGHSEERDRIQICNRKDATLLAQLRAGHCRHLKAYENLMDPTTDPTCPLCQQEPQTLEHWLCCQGMERQRINPGEAAIGQTRPPVNSKNLQLPRRQKRIIRSWRPNLPSEPSRPRRPSPTRPTHPTSKLHQPSNQRP